MNVNINKISSNRIELEIEIPIPQMEIYFNLAASELSKNMKVDGFRSGKVPAEIVEREKGSQELYNQAANLAVHKTLPRAILDNEIEVVGKPDITITQIARGNSMKYKVLFWIVPEVKLGEYKGLEVKKKGTVVKDDEINKSLEYLQKSRVKLVTVNRSVKKGDRVEINFITRSNGIKIEGGESQNHPLIVGEGKFIPGFEKELEGMRTGEEKKFSLRSPKEWHQKNLADKKLDFEIKLNLVQERDMPELSDEFAGRLGDFKSLDHLKKSIKEGILEEKEKKEKERIRMKLIEKVAQNSKMDISEALINIELDKMVDELQGSVQSMGLDFDKYLQEIKKNTEDLKKEWQDQAKKRVRIGLTLKTIAQKEKIEINNSEIEERTSETLKNYPEAEEAKKNIDLEALRAYTKGVIRNEKVFELLEREAKLT